MRKVIVSEYGEDEYTAYFHAFYSSKDYSSPLAIVECMDGSVRTVFISDIRFIDKPSTQSIINHN